MATGHYTLWELWHRGHPILQMFLLGVILFVIGLGFSSWTVGGIGFLFVAFIIGIGATAYYMGKLV
ncbi:hypothetical protein EXS73_03640 [Candidatus Pacearchaeota archaeon]|nr:hypothetical protein [Candidatus Pacearchaeota archaeon]